MRYILSLAACLLLASSALAGTRTPLPTNAEASQLVTGTIEVGADGTLLHYAVDHPEKLDEGVLHVIDLSAAGWRFKPMVATEKATMSLSIHASKDESGHYRTWVDSADFEPLPAQGVFWSWAKSTTPDYPSEALQAGVGGTVYLSLHVARDGTVADVFVSRVDLDTEDKPVTMDHWRSVLGDVSAKVARSWRFRPPTNPLDEAVTLTVPVTFSPDWPQPKPRYGQWTGYFPGPFVPAPWLPAPETSSLRNASALAANGIYPVKHNGPELATPLGAN
ncbi:MAG TPA: energy transducer TonB [Xanthomonadaceae bacterium]|nr:energy transducer TonB [Xanthomonadaceae bacterium]